MLDKLLLEYADKFNENFPIFLVIGKSEEEIIKIIQTCLKNKQVFHPGYVVSNDDY